MKGKKDLTLITQLVLSILIFIGGVTIMIFKSFGLIDMVLYGSIIFFILAFFGVICYFVRRREGDYEILLFSLISILTATFMFIFKNDDAAMILGAGLTIFNILVVANRIYKIITYKNQDNFMWSVKFIGTFLIGFLAILTCVNLYKEISVQTLMLGYYFTCLGVIMTIENLVELFVTKDKFDKFVSKVVENEYKNLEMVDAINEEVKPEVKPEVKEVSVVIEKKRGRKPKIEVNGKDVNKEIKKEVKKVKKELKPVKKELKKKAKPVVKAIEKETKPVVKTIEKETKPLKKKVEKEIKPVKKEVKKAVKTANKKVNKVKREVKKAVIKEEIKKEIKEVKKKGRPKKTN